VHRQLDKRQRAVLAAEVIDGMVMFIPSQRQISLLFNVSSTYVDLARKFSPGKRMEILRGWNAVSFAELLRPPRQLSLAGPVLPVLKIFSDSDLEHVARVVGTDRMLAAACAVEHA
jgi:hypothetical protein